MENQNKIIIEYIKNHELEAFSNLLKSNKDIDLCFTDLKGRTLLHHVVGKISQNGLPLLQILLEHGVDPNSVDEKFQNAMDIAKSIDNVPALAMLKHFLNKNNQELQSYL